MLGGYVLRYLAAVAETGTLEGGASRIAAPLRTLTRRRATKHVVAASFDTSHADDVAHVHRMAYLRAVGVPTVDSNDVDGVRQTFDASRRRGAEGRAPLTFLLGLTALAAVFAAAGFGYWVWTRPPPRPEPIVREDARSLDDILGIEGPSHPLEPVFARRVPEWVIALDRRRAGRERPPPDDVASRHAAALETVESPEVRAALSDLLDAAEGYVDGAEGHDEAFWSSRVALFHDALEDADAPYFVDAILSVDLRSGQRRLRLSTFDVHGQRAFRSGDRSVRALDIERLDDLNFERGSLLGYTRPESRYALVVRDRIERFLVEDVLPSVHGPNDSVIVRGYEDESGIEWVTDFEGWAHEDLRREAVAVVHDAGALEALAEAVVRRRRAIAALSRSLTGVRIREPRAYDYDIDELAELTRDGDRDAVRETRQAQEAMASAPIRAAYDALLEARSASVAEHEVQHRLDYESDRLVHVPEALSRYVGESAELDGANRRAERANAELSAYLAQIARRPSLAFTSLIHVASFVMNRRSWRMPEAYAAVALFEALADAAGLEHEDLIRDRAVDRGEVARLYGALRERDAAAISGLAERTWSALYGTALPPLEEAE